MFLGENFFIRRLCGKDFPGPFLAEKEKLFFTPAFLGLSGKTLRKEFEVD